MASNVIMPQMGESVAEGTVVKWLKKVGDRVERDEALLEISTDKVDAEIPSPAAGVLTRILVKENETVEVSSVLAVIDENGAAAAPPPAEQADGAPGRSTDTSPEPTIQAHFQPGPSPGSASVSTAE